ncbi:glycerophosphodiester phosphodiesterase [Cellulomonas endophytica]|uniref:glycerophosphodiester phosphodiesterase n=1 Tax=Cellulomonas endophytica TaxID=2494735 RepID=UPI0010137BB7|nr:glycerophosphodiester phosphodiesterase [Cellulomonas endophytica]
MTALDARPVAPGPLAPGPLAAGPLTAGPLVAGPVPPAAAVPTPRRRPKVVAHRGNSSVAPQNTLAALEAAWRAGADAVEIDVQLTRDGGVVVLHDDSVDATTNGTGRLADLDAAHVRALDAGSWFSRAYVGQRVPVWEEVIDFLLTRPGIDLLLELKGPWTVDEAARVTAPLLAAGLADRVVAQSFWPETVGALAEAAPQLRLGLLVVDAPDDLVDRCLALGVVACNPFGLLLVQDPGLVDRLHAAGLEVMTWTLDEPEQWELAVARGVDAVITDRPDRMAGWLAVQPAPAPA